MPRAHSTSATPAALRQLALALPGAEEGVACAGTALESRTIKAGKKAFLFLRPKELMLKLGASLPEAEHLAKAEPARCKVGAHGWVTLSLADPPPLALAQAWVEESYRLLAPAATQDRPAKKAAAPRAKAPPPAGKRKKKSG